METRFTHHTTSLLKLFKHHHHHTDERNNICHHLIVPRVFIDVAFLTWTMMMWALNVCVPCVLLRDFGVPAFRGTYMF